MPLIKCPTCSREISDQAFACPQCGHPIRAESSMPVGAAVSIISSRHGRYWGGFEYRSNAKILGLPLIHIATGFDVESGRKRVAKGFIAIGDIAIGVLALGGLSVGICCFGGLAVGAACVGGLSIGAGLAIGGAAVGYFALGGAALGYYAIGGMAIGAHTFSALYQDPEVFEFISRTIGIDLQGLPASFIRSKP